MGRYKCAYDCEHSSDSDVKFFKWVLIFVTRKQRIACRFVNSLANVS